MTIQTTKRGKDRNAVARGEPKPITWQEDNGYKEWRDITDDKPMALGIQLTDEESYHGTKTEKKGGK